MKFSLYGSPTRLVFAG